MIRTALVGCLLFAAGCRSSAHPDYMQSCAVLEAGAADGGRAVRACSAGLTCTTPMVVCVVACTTDQGCQAMQPGTHPGTHCGAWGCEFLCAEDGDCPDGFVCGQPPTYDHRICH